MVPIEKPFEFFAAGMYICCAEVSGVDPDILPDVISPYRAERLRGLKRKDARQRSIGAELLLGYAVGKRYPDIKLPIDYTVDAFGKPYIRGGGVFFSISHSATVAACAVSDSPVGVDVERVRDVRRGVMMRCFTDSERELSSDSGAFTRIWTRKEAVAKADGRGLAVGLAGFDVTGERTRVGDAEYEIVSVECPIEGFKIAGARRL